jgi:integrase
MKAKITQKLIADLKPQKRDYDVWDTETPGLIARCRTSGAVSYAIVYRDTSGRRMRYTIGGAATWTVPAVRAEARRLLAEIHLGANPQETKLEARKPSATLKDFLDNHYEPWASVNLKSGPATCKRLRTVFADFLDTPMPALSPFEIERWRSKRVKDSKRLDAGNRPLACLKSAVSKAVAWGLIESNPIEGVRLARIDRKREIRVLDAKEEARLMAALDARQEEARAARASHNAWLAERHQPLLPDLRQCEFTDYLKPMVLLALNCGLRRGELFGIEWGDVDLKNRRLSIRGTRSKSGQTRRVPLNAVAYQTLKAWRKQTTGDAALVFPNSEGGRFDNVNTAWLGVRKAAHLPGIGLHTLRHSFCSRLVARGVDLETCRVLMGHHSLAVTQVYCHSSEEQMRAAVDKLA